MITRVRFTVEGNDDLARLAAIYEQLTNAYQVRTNTESTMQFTATDQVKLELGLESLDMMVLEGKHSDRLFEVSFISPLGTSLIVPETGERLTVDFLSSEFKEQYRFGNTHQTIVRESDSVPKPVLRKISPTFANYRVSGLDIRLAYTPERASR